MLRIRALVLLDDFARRGVRNPTAPWPPRSLRRRQQGALSTWQVSATQRPQGAWPPATGRLQVMDGRDGVAELATDLLAAGAARPRSPGSSVRVRTRWPRRRTFISARRALSSALAL